MIGQITKLAECECGADPTKLTKPNAVEITDVEIVYSPIQVKEGPNGDGKRAKEHRGV